jgi:hypothetical protein
MRGKKAGATYSAQLTEILYRIYDLLTHRDAHDPLPFLPPDADR